MQLADEVERPRGHRASRRFYPSPGLALLSRFTSHVSPLREPTHTIAFPEFSTALAMTPNIYCQRQPWPTNNSSAFTQCGTHATNIGSAATFFGDARCIVGCYWLLFEMVG